MSAFDPRISSPTLCTCCLTLGQTDCLFTGLIGWAMQYKYTLRLPAPHENKPTHKGKHDVTWHQSHWPYPVRCSAPALLPCSQGAASVFLPCWFQVLQREHETGKSGNVYSCFQPWFPTSLRSGQEEVLLVSSFPSSWQNGGLAVTFQPFHLTTKKTRKGWLTFTLFQSTTVVTMACSLVKALALGTSASCVHTLLHLTSGRVKTTLRPSLPGTTWIWCNLGKRSAGVSIFKIPMSFSPSKRHSLRVYQ